MESGTQKSENVVVAHVAEVLAKILVRERGDERIPLVRDPDQRRFELAHLGAPHEIAEESHTGDDATVDIEAHVDLSRRKPLCTLQRARRILAVVPAPAPIPALDQLARERDEATPAGRFATALTFALTENWRGLLERCRQDRSLKENPAVFSLYLRALGERIEGHAELHAPARCRQLRSSHQQSWERSRHVSEYRVLGL